MIDLDNCIKEMDLATQAFKNEISNIRTDRVSPDSLNTILVDSYGSKMKLNQISNITNIDNKSLNISVWDAGLVQAVEKSIIDSNLGVTPQTNGPNIILSFPELTSERRKELVKFISEISEKYRVSIRNLRRKFIDIIKDEEKNKLISQDDSKKFQDQVQEITNSHILNIDNYLKEKEKDLLKI
ncbi:MAG: ribosome recycling factor [Pelagibacteraceae bacterium]|nr:ribosome recycling factor [Pelagibacteraceae bacterium]|tara:strand:+ start:1451 stop:2002 length:552 start_codon:yes stop_codon:yes gene_type:complete